MRAVRTAVRAGLAGRRVQAWAIGLVMLATATASTLAAGLVAASNAPFDHAFTAQRGADATVVVNARKAPAAELAATARLADVTAAAGPFAEATVTATAVMPGAPGVTQLPPLTLAGRSSPGGPVDDIVLSSGHWPTATGQIVVSRGQSGPGPGPELRLGQVITLTGAPGSPKLTVVGVGTSVTGTAGGWVLPAQMTALRIPLTEQMLYRFASAGSGAAVSAGIAAVRHALPAGSVAGAESWLTVKSQEAGLAGPLVPFLVTFGLIGMVMSVLIVVNVVSGAVVAGTRRIGVLKAVGFTPAQVVSVYVLQVGVPTVAGVVSGAITANLIATPMLSRVSQLYAVAPQFIPPWVDLTVPLAMLGMAGIAALVSAYGAGRLSAVQTIGAGRAPRPSRGYAAHRLLGRVRVLPRPVTIGLARSFARPGRTLVTFTAILFGAVAVTFGAGLGSSVNRVMADGSLPGEQVQIGLPGPPGQAGQPWLPGQLAPASAPSVAAQESASAAALGAQPGTLHYVTESDDQLAVPGMAGTAWVTAFGGGASWIGYTLISGHWYGTGGAVANTAFLDATGKHVGDTFTLTGDGRAATLTITGEALVFGPPGSSSVVLTNLSSVAALDPSGLSPQLYDVDLRPGVNARGYANAVAAKLGQEYSVITPDNPLVNPLSTLIGLLTLLLAAVAGLGVLNTVVLMTRERVHDLGVFKAVGMTPRQMIAMVVTTVATTGLVAGLIAVPAGTALHHAILPIMASGAQTALPAAVYNVYNPPELVLLALAGLVIAVAGALAPAGWAARTPTALALRAE
jgi:putative ABC transport system permease protein